MLHQSPKAVVIILFSLITLGMLMVLELMLRNRCRADGWYWLSRSVCDLDGGGNNAELQPFQVASVLSAFQLIMFEKQLCGICKCLLWDGEKVLTYAYRHFQLPHIYVSTCTSEWLHKASRHLRHQHFLKKKGMIFTLCKFDLFSSNL